jgi:hypothetical protein
MPRAIDLILGALALLALIGFALIEGREATTSALSAHRLTHSAVEASQM